MNFEQDFRQWLQHSLMITIPGDVHAFCFNLYEPALMGGVKFGVELIGASGLHEKDQDWPCDEVWEPPQRSLNIPLEYSGSIWQDCLKRMRTLLLQVLSENTDVTRILKSKAGVGIGFNDGDLELIWKR